MRLELSDHLGECLAVRVYIDQAHLPIPAAGCQQLTIRAGSQPRRGSANLQRKKRLERREAQQVHAVACREGQSPPIREPG